MTKHLLRDLEHLKKELLGVGSLVESAIDLATTSLLERRPELAMAVIQGDEEVDSREVAIEEDCLKTLALHQPVAFDLRYIVAVLKVNNDLERMGDLAVNIAERAVDLSAHSPVPPPPGFDRMVESVRRMVRMSLDALVQQDVARAEEVLRADAVVDALHREIFAATQERMRQDPDVIHQGLCAISASRNLERIADQATNIAEDVLFLVQGEIIRHRKA
jgi:phosphate transport system protein